MSKVIIIDNVQNTTLYKILLKKKDDSTKELIVCLPSICDEACDRIKLLPKYFSEYTLHDKTHFIRVTEIMAMVLGKTINDLNSLEIILLILSAFFHDQGMLVDNSELEKIKKTDEFILFMNNWYLENPNYNEIVKQIDSEYISQPEKIRLSSLLNELDAAMLADYLRTNHGKNSSYFIIKKYSSDKRLNVSGYNIANLLAKICHSHVQPIDWINSSNGFHLDENIGIEKVNITFLALILRLADILDFDSDRTPEVLYRSIHFTSPISFVEWQKHRTVSGWEISNKLIRYSMYFEHPVYEKTAKEFIDWIDIELSQVNNAIRNFPSDFSKYKIEIPVKVDRSRLLPKDNSYLYHDVEFTLSRNEIVKLLLTDKLYNNPSLFIRELLQNSLDALRLKKALYKNKGFDWDSGKVNFHHYIDDDDQEVFECTDNGSGMDENIIINFFGKIGRSYYRSPEFDRQRIQFKESKVDFDPCSKFGIGFMSCFMIGDRFEILTRKDYGPNQSLGKPLKVEINGLGGLIVIKKGKDNQETGTKVRIYSRKKPLYYDRYYDKIKLISFLKGYALATEFPIHAKCSIPEIKETTKISDTIDKKATFLEEIELKEIITIEIDFSTINENLNGFIRQSFIINDSKIPCIENKEAKWIVKSDNKTWIDRSENKLYIHNKKNNTTSEYGSTFTRESASVCLDGILVCGSPGRSTHSKNEIVGLGMLSSSVISEHAFTIDVRGDIKPELNPAREPLNESNSIFNNAVGWKQLQKFVRIGSGLIWDKIIQLTNKGLNHEDFWKLLLIYECSPHHISSKLLYEYLKIPIEDSNEWILLKDIKLFYFIKDDLFVNISDKDLKVGLPHSIKLYDSAHRNTSDIYWWLSSLLICMSELKFDSNKDHFTIRRSFAQNERPVDVILTKTLGSIRLVNFINVSSNYVMAMNFPLVVNRENPIIKLALDSELIKDKNTLEEFSHSFTLIISNLVSDFNKNNKPFEFNLKWRQLKYLSKLYSNINWGKYPEKFKPPYKVYIDKNTTFEITDDMLKSD